MSGRPATLGEPGPERPSPILATGLAAAVIGDSSGRMELSWESRGAVMEWGGAYAAGIRLTGPWTLRIATPGQVVTLPAPGATVRALPGRWEVLHAFPPLSVRESVVVSPAGPAIGRELSVSTTGDSDVRVLVESEFRPYLAPVLVEGVKPYDYQVRTSGEGAYVSSHRYGLALDALPLPSHLSLNRASWLGGQWEGELSSVMSDHEGVARPGVPAVFRWVIWGGLEATIEHDPQFGVRWLREGDGWVESCDRPWNAWIAGTPVLRFPQAPELERGCALATAALRRLYTSPDPAMTGLVAGYPWYGAIWCRDLAWMLPAVLWLGDFDWAARSLRTVFRYQAPRTLRILGASKGEIPMQVSPGPIFLFGTSDTTLYYPSVIDQWTRHAGDPSLAMELSQGVDAAIRWGRAKCDGTTGLFRHGGEVEAIDGVTHRFGSIHFGIDAIDTTIWDSTDRRDHAIDLQALWISALEAAADLSSGVDAPASAGGLRAEAAQVRGRLGAYRWAEEGYLFDSLRVDGTPVKKLRPNALRAVSAGLLPPEWAIRAVRRAAREDLSTPWGVRTLSSGAPEYDPQAYHDGQVWSIATAWAADAALSVGESDLGIRYLNILARHLLSEQGLANECYRGDRAEPFNSCFLLGFSVAPFLTTVFERLWGLRIGPGAQSIAIDPRFPAGWEQASLHSLRVGDGLLDLEWHPTELGVRWRGTRPIEVVAPVARVVVLPSTTASIPWGAARPKTS
ncbi:MAG: hypothetical protein L3K19_00570 [Thermoplasmata archaeon]|nr:hypothetical protein [Thermoplasmata archaeon]